MFDGKGFQAIKAVVEIHEEQLKHITGAELIKFVEARENHIRSGNVYREERLAA